MISPPRLPEERQAQRFTHNTVSTLCTNEPLTLEMLFKLLSVVSFEDARDHSVRELFKGHQLGSQLDRDTVSGQMFTQYLLVSVLAYQNRVYLKHMSVNRLLKKYYNGARKVDQRCSA